MLSESDDFPYKDLASVVASKVFYHLEVLDDAVRYALQAGDKFDPSSSSDFAQTVVSQCVDKYIAHQRAQFRFDVRARIAAEVAQSAAEAAALNEGEEEEDFGNMEDVDENKGESLLGVNAVAAPEPLDPRLKGIVDRVFLSSLRAGKYKQVAGLAIESHRLDVLQNAVLQADKPLELLSYVKNVAAASVNNKIYREEILRVLVQLYKASAAKVAASSSSSTSSSGAPQVQGLDADLILAMSQCLVELADVTELGDSLVALVSGTSERDHLLAYQIAFDVSENQDRTLQTKVIQHILPGKLTTTSSSSSSASSPTASAAPAAPAAPAAAGAGAGAATTPTPTATGTNASDSFAITPPRTGTVEERLSALADILTGHVSADLQLHFLYAHNKTDLNVLKGFKEAGSRPGEPRNPIVHGATIVSHAFMHSGTTVDTFLRDNWEWLGQATSWAKFSAASSIGVLHRGHHRASQRLLASFLPPPNRSAANAGSVSASAAFQEGGALFALGIMNAGISFDQTQYLRDSLVASGTNDVLTHGACLGLGLSAIGSHDEGIYHDLRGVVFAERSVASEAAAYACGLVMMGSENAQAARELLRYARETSQEKIIRGIATALALMSFAREERADTLISQMVQDKDPIIRVGGSLAIGLAYAATSNASALQRLLHLAVSDASDDVRRNAVMSIGFVQANDPAQTPKLVGLLAQSYNQHVRYGACLAVGISCANKGLSIPEAYALVQPMLTDATDYVRQGAFIAMGMLMMQLVDTPTTGGKVESFRKAISEVMARRSDSLTKVGALYGAGILDAGGRNSVIQLLAPSGSRRMVAFAGMTLFTQFWFWFPLANMLALSFQPACLIGLDSQLRKPAGWKVVSNAPASQFAYPSKQEGKKAEVTKAKVVNVLSVAQKKKKKRDGDDLSMSRQPSLTLSLSRHMSSASTLPTAASGTSSSTAVAGGVAGEPVSAEKAKEAKEAEEKAAAAEKKKKEEDALFSILTAPCRVLPEQQQHIVIGLNQRYVPVKSKVGAGFVLLADKKPNEDVAVEEQAKVNVAIPGVSSDEPSAPAGFDV